MEIALKSKSLATRIVVIVGLLLCLWVSVQWIALLRHLSEFQTATRKSDDRTFSAGWIPYHRSVIAPVFENFFGFAGDKLRYSARGTLAEKLFRAFSGEKDNFRTRYAREQVKDATYHPIGYLLLGNEGRISVYRIAVARDSEPIDVRIYKLPTMESAIGYVELNAEEFSSILKQFDKID